MEPEFSKIGNFMKSWRSGPLSGLKSPRGPCWRDFNAWGPGPPRRRIEITPAKYFFAFVCTCTFTHAHMFFDVHWPVFMFNLTDMSLYICIADLIVAASCVVCG